MSHEQKLTLHVDINVPDHDERTASATFRHSRHQMVDVEQQGCWICGTREQLESHHLATEWCFSNAVDFSVGSNIRQDFPNFDWEHFEKPEDFVDSTTNLLTLCKFHHTGPGGIHSLPYSVWRIQRYLKKDFQLLVPPEQKPLHKRMLHKVKTLLGKKNPNPEHL